VSAVGPDCGAHCSFDGATSVFDDLSLVHGALWAVLGLTGAGLARAMARRRRWWSVTLPVLVALTWLLVLAWYLRVSVTGRDHYPPPARNRRRWTREREELRQCERR
jgi:cell division protein FtsW (lipid II flippase)